MKILLAIDESEHSQRAWQYYLDNLHKEGNELVLCHCLEIPYQPAQPMAMGASVYEDVLGQARKESKETSDKFVKMCDDKSIANSVVCDFDRPGEFVVKKAKDEEVAMIVMGTRGMGLIRRTIMGSVSDYVVHHAHCPVLICRH